MIRGLYTSEFLLALLASVLATLKATVLPDLPEEAFYAVITYILSRTLVKAAARK